MVIPLLSSRNKGSYLDKGPSQEQIERRNMIKHKLCLDVAGDDDIDSLAGDDDDYMMQLIEAPPTPSRSSGSRRLRSASPQKLGREPSPTLLRRCKSNEGEGIPLGNHSNRSNRSTRPARSLSTGSPKTVQAPKRTSSFGGFAGFLNMDKSEHRNQSAHLRTPSSSSRRARRDEGSAHSSQQIICIGKSYRNSLSQEDASASDDEIWANDRSLRNSSRRTRTYSPSKPTVPTRQSRSLGSNTSATNSFKKNVGEGTKKFKSLLKSKKEKQTESHVSPSASSRSDRRRIKSLGRSRSGDLSSIGQFKSPTRSSSWDGPGWGGSPQPRMERRYGFIPGAASPVSSRHRRLKIPSLDKDISETDETGLMDSNNFRSSRPSSASSKEEIFNNAVRRAKERQQRKQQQQDLEQQQEQEQQPSYTPMQGRYNATYKDGYTEDTEYPDKSQRPSLFNTIRDQTGSLFPKRPSQPQQHLRQQQQQQVPPSTWTNDDDEDDDDESIVSQDMEVPTKKGGPSIFERGLMALEQIYDDLNV